MTPEELERLIIEHERNTVSPTPKAGPIGNIATALPQQLRSIEGVESRALMTGPICEMCGQVIHGAHPTRMGTENRVMHAHRECANRRGAQRRTEQLRAEVLAILTQQFPTWEGANIDNREFMDSANEQLATMATQWTPADGHVLIIGPTGKKKTMMLRALAFRWGDEVIASGRKDPLFAGLVFAKAFRLGESAKWHKLGEGAPPELERARNASVLMLDDLGQENAGTEQSLFALLDDRYDRGAPTLVTSGLTIDQLKTRYGSHLFRRIVETGIGSLIDMHARGKLQAVR